MKHTLKKNMHLLKDLKALIRTLDLTGNVQLLTDNQADIPPEMLYDTAEAEPKSASHWKKVPEQRRARATNLYQIAASNANMALALGGECSVSVTRTIIWGGKASAKTIPDAVDGGGNSGTTHVVRIDFAGLVAMEKNPELLVRASNLGLPVISLYPMPRNPGIFQAIWVANHDGKIKSVSGWITYDNSCNITFYGK